MYAYKKMNIFGSHRPCPHQLTELLDPSLVSIMREERLLPWLLIIIDWKSSAVKTITCPQLQKITSRKLIYTYMYIKYEERMDGTIEL